MNCVITDFSLFLIANLVNLLVTGVFIARGKGFERIEYVRTGGGGAGVAFNNNLCFECPEPARLVDDFSTSATDSLLRGGIAV